MTEELGKLVAGVRRLEAYPPDSLPRRILAHVLITEANAATYTTKVRTWAVNDALAALEFDDTATAINILEEAS